MVLSEKRCPGIEKVGQAAQAVIDIDHDLHLV